MTAQLVKHEPTIVVELKTSQWRTIADRARNQAEKCKDWTVVNFLDDAFTLAFHEPIAERKGTA
jgi:hypothetical protein